MPEITSIKPQKNGRRVNIYLDGRFGFGIDLENFISLGLKEGKSYEDNEINEIIKKALFQKTLDKLLRFAILRPRSQKEFELWLKKKKVHASLHDELLSKLKKMDLLDDYKFSLWWIDQRSAFKPRGKRALKYELFNKGIDKDTIERVLSEKNINEEKIAKGLLQKNTYKWKRYKGIEQKNKKSQFLISKGINWETIKRVL